MGGEKRIRGWDLTVFYEILVNELSHQFGSRRLFLVEMDQALGKGLGANRALSWNFFRVITEDELYRHASPPVQKSKACQSPIVNTESPFPDFLGNTAVHERNLLKKWGPHRG